jgi:hypothetical protein
MHAIAPPFTGKKAASYAFRLRSPSFGGQVALRPSSPRNGFAVIAGAARLSARLEGWATGHMVRDARLRGLLTMRAPSLPATNAKRLRKGALAKAIHSFFAARWIASLRSQ